MTTEDVKGEVRAIRRICTTGHPNIVQVYSDWEEMWKGDLSLSCFIVMERCDYNFEALLNNEHESVDFWSDWFCDSQFVDLKTKLQILEGIIFIHGMNEIHRDLKPANSTHLFSIACSLANESSLGKKKTKAPARLFTRSEILDSQRLGNLERNIARYRDG